ncbi:unnamed protein product, partial [Medioppia subpectinata]
MVTLTEVLLLLEEKSRKLKPPAPEGPPDMQTYEPFESENQLEVNHYNYKGGNKQPPHDRPYKYNSKQKPRNEDIIYEMPGYKPMDNSNGYDGLATMESHHSSWYRTLHMLDSRVRVANTGDAGHPTNTGGGQHSQPYNNDINNEFLFDFDRENTGPVFHLVRELPHNFALSF